MRSLLRRWLRQADGSDGEIAEIIDGLRRGGDQRDRARRRRVGGTPFEVAGRLDDGVVDIAVRDYGAWRPPREGDQGRGLSLMDALMDEVEVTPSPDGTTVRCAERRALSETAR